MIVPDVNLLVYAYDSTSPFHERSRSWWESALPGPIPVGIPAIVILAFVRLVTHPALTQNPMTVQQAREAVTAWLSVSHVRLLLATPAALDLFFDLLEASGTGGNRSTDALIAAMAAVHGGTVYSNDRDFARFTSVRWRNPLES